MSTAATPALAPELESYARAWAKSMAAARRSISAATCEVSAQAPSNAPAVAEGDVWIAATSSGELSGVVAFRMDRLGGQPAASEKAEAVEELSGETKTTLLDWMRRAASAVPAHLQRRPDQQFQVDFTDSPLDNPAATFWLQIETGDANPIVVEVRMDGKCVLSLQSMKNVSVAEIPSPAEFAASKMGMLMEVELVVKVRFGGRRMLLKDILDLCAGSVVELDQEVQEPVDLLLDGKLIARGEVVVVDGNYGLRITEVLSSAGN
jgi:flagellar motor switch protein FliN